MKLINLLIIGMVVCGHTTKAEDDFSIQRELSYTKPFETKTSSGEPVQCYSTEQVKRWHKKKTVKKAEPQVVEKVVEKEKIVEKEVDSSYKNRVKLYLGVAPGYTNPEVNGSTVTLEDKLGVVPGIGYERLLDKRWSVGGTILFNKSYLIDVGYGF